MDILNLNDILYLVFNAFNIYVKYRFMRIFFTVKVTNGTVEFVTFTAYFLASSALHILFANPIVNLAVNVLFFFFLTFLYAGRLSTRLISTLLVYSVGMLLEYAVYYFTLNITLISELDDVSNIIANIFKFMLVLVLERLLKHRTTQKLDAIHWLAIFFIPLGSVIIVITAFYTKWSTIGAVVNVSILLCTNIMVFYLYDVILKNYQDKYERALLEQQNTAYKNQFELINKSQNLIRMLKHDMKNHIAIIQEMCQNDKKEELLNYLKQTSGFISSKNEYVETGNSEVDSILNFKLAEAQKTLSDIRLDVNISDNIAVEAFDLNVILSNLIDNALDALKNANEKRLSIEIALDRNVLYITIKNTHCGNIKSKNGKIQTTKEDASNHGLGLKSVEHILEKYNGTLSIEHTDSDFTVSAMLYNNII